MKQKQFWKYLTRLHRWAGFVLGLQITLWFASGFFMSVFSIEKVRGTHLAQKQSVSLDYTPEVSIEDVISLYRGRPNSIHLISAVGTPVYTVKGESGDQWFDGRSGVKWLGVTADNVRASALLSYKGYGQITSVQRLEEAPIEYRATLPVWQVQFNDASDTRLYFNAYSGELSAVRTRLWRVFDFMWMLHIMDYQARENINLIWLKLFSGAALLFALSGLALVVHRMWLRPKARKPKRVAQKNINPNV